MERKYRVSVDRMEITYEDNIEFKTALMSMEIGDSKEFGKNKELILTRYENPNYLYSYEIRCWDIVNFSDCQDIGNVNDSKIIEGDDGVKRVMFRRCYGKLIFQPVNKFRQKIYLAIENEILYDTFMFATVFYMEEAFGLQFKRISKLDIAVDFNYNVIRSFYRLFKNKDLRLFINGSEVKTMEERINNVQHLASNNSRKRPFSNHTPLITNANKTLTLSAYNKLQEIEDKSEKYYIKKKLDFNRIYRMEVRMDNFKVIKPTMNQLLISNEKLLYNLQDESFQKEVFLNAVDRLIYFSVGRKKVNFISALLSV